MPFGPLVLFNGRPFVYKQKGVVLFVIEDSATIKMGCCKPKPLLHKGFTTSAAIIMPSATIKMGCCKPKPLLHKGFTTSAAMPLSIQQLLYIYELYLPIDVIYGYFLFFPYLK